MPAVGFILYRPHIHSQFSILQFIYICQAKGCFNMVLFTDDRSSSLVTFQFNVTRVDCLSMGHSPVLPSIYTGDSILSLSLIPIYGDDLSEPNEN